MNTQRWLAAPARSRPDAEALFDVDAARRWTWSQLHAEALGWAGLLRARGVVAGDRVAVLAGNRGETFALLFACAHLGAMLAPLNWRLAEAELAWQLADLEPRVRLGEGSTLALLGDGAIDLDAGPGPVDREPAASVAAADPWLVLYTSGSSGRPKGALLTHGQILANARNTGEACDLRRASVALTLTPLFHTGGMNCLSTPVFWRGGRVVLTRSFDPQQALSLLGPERVTHLMGVPTIFQMLADHPDFAHTDLSGVRDALCGGAPLPLPLLERYLARGVPLRQGFGLTEVGPNCFSLPADRLLDKLGSVGRPLRQLDARLVAKGSACAPGETGELQLRGDVVCGGYWKRADAFAAAMDGDWFRTGDLLSADAEGFFYVRGRAKEMFISGGENVYPAEVEAALGDHPGVAQVAVLGVPDARWGEVGHAWVETRPSVRVTPDELARFLDGRLARYKRPKRIAVIGKLPRTGSGKIDKVALRASLA